MILITGATGTNGIELIRTLSAGNHPVRALVRDPQRAAERLPSHVELARGDFDDVDSLAEAMDGVDRLFLLAPVDARIVELEGRAVDAAKRAGIGHVVKLSVAHVDSGDDTFFARTHGQSEAHLKRPASPGPCSAPHSSCRTCSGWRG
jgi:uncharacterized protein YbjT (DUF2867 family)